MAAVLPLSFDEAYYWLWSKHLALSYYDHPPVIAYAIRAGTLLFGDTAFGVRIVPLLFSAGASWAVWRGGAILFGSEKRRRAFGPVLQSDIDGHRRDHDGNAGRTADVRRGAVRLGAGETAGDR